jgi:diguanylate cyclase (GGDEF)-like protein
VSTGPTIGVLSPYVGGNYYGEVLGGIVAAAAQVDGRVVAVQTLEAGSFHAYSVGTPDFRHRVAWDVVDGFVVVANAVDPDYLEALRAAGKPVVMVSYEVEGFECPVVLPGTSGIQAAVTHLVEHGHARIGFVGCRSVFDISERYEAYAESMRDLGIEPDPALCFEASNNHETGGDHAARAMLDAGMPATAVVVGTDLNAVGLMRTLIANGRRVPEDLAVIGFDDIDAARHLVPSLSSVRQPLGALGRAAVGLLLGVSRGDHVPPSRTYVAAPLMTRESCGCPDPFTLPGQTMSPESARDQVREQFAGTRYYQAMLATQYEMSMGLLRSHEEDPRALGWLERTSASGGCLGLWTAPDSAGERSLAISGMVRDRGPLATRDEIRTVEAFPPPELLDLADRTPADAVLVVPVRMDTSDWGLLALAGAIEDKVPAGREIVNQSAALLAVALDHEAVLVSMRVQEEQLRRTALYDDLTGLPNRTLFLDRLSVAIARMKRTRVSDFAVLFFDVDGFKVVNDSLGHAAGDRLLVQVAERLRRNLRDNDTAARFGGDEFIVLLEDAGHPDSAIATVARLQQALASPFVLAGEEMVVTASVGIALSAPRYDSAEDVLRDADIAMYSAKSHQKGSYAVFDVAMHSRAVTRLQVEADLRRALERGEFELHYQPIMDLETHTVSAFEALIRWRHPTRGLVPPDQFLVVAEECGLMVPIGCWVLGEACRQLVSWQRAGVVSGEVAISVNISNRQFWHDDLLAVVRSSLAQSGLPAHCLSLEITEGVIMSNVEEARTMLADLHALGLALHIDDFGTGYSSLEALHNLPLDALKIDRAFVARLDSDPRSAELVRTIVLMGANLGLDLVAEGIETASQRERLHQLGCRYGQGFLFSRPVPATEAVRWVGQQRDAGLRDGAEVHTA